MAMKDRLPNIPDVTGKTVEQDQQLRDLLISIKTTLEKLTGYTWAELQALLNEND